MLSYLNENIFMSAIDLEACVWLEEELKTYKRILVIISHSQDFMNSVCTNVIHLDQKKLKYYGVSIHSIEIHYNSDYISEGECADILILLLVIFRETTISLSKLVPSYLKTK